MSFFLRLMIALVILLASHPAAASQQWNLVADKSRITFTGDSTLHGFHGKAQTVSGGFQEDQASAKGSISADILGLTTENRQRDKNMYRMFEEKKYPEIRFDFDRMDMNSITDGQPGVVTISGVLTIHNIPQPVTVTAKARRVDGILICDGTLDISLKAYDLHPPSMLMVVRVSDQVQVNYTLAFTKS